MNRLLWFMFWRLFSMLPTVVLVIILGFCLLALSPGDAVDAYLAQSGGDAGFAAQLRQSYGLTSSFTTRLVAYGQGLLHGNLGRSFIHARPVWDLIIERLPLTIALAFGALCIALPLGFLLGVMAGIKPNSLTDRLITLLTLGLFAMPNFWIGLLLVLVFSLQLPLLPVSGADTISHFILPSIALGAGYIALYARALRSAMVEAWAHPMVRAAQARGLSFRSVVTRTVLRPSLVPFIAVMAQNIGTLLGGSIVVETLFSIPGLGSLALEAVRGRDPMLLCGLVIVIALMVMLVQLVADGLSHWLLQKEEGRP